LIAKVVVTITEEEEKRMRESRKLPLDRAATLLDAVGGEQVAGSGFEAEEPDRGFATDELSKAEYPTHHIEARSGRRDICRT
jgi:hypothetical protein